MKLAPMPDSYDLDRGLLLAVQAIQVRSILWDFRNENLKVFSAYFIEYKTYDFCLLLQALLENNGFPVIVGIGNVDLIEPTFPYPISVPFVDGRLCVSFAVKWCKSKGFN